MFYDFLYLPHNYAYVFVFFLLHCRLKAYEKILSFKILKNCLFLTAVWSTESAHSVLKLANIIIQRMLVLEKVSLCIIHLLVIF